MNAPFRKPETESAAGTLHVFALFHLNLAFSSIEEEQRSAVIARCYWPLLKLAEAHGPIGIEASGLTLEEIAARDPAWIASFKALIAQGRAELIGAGYTQMIAPLVPARVTEANLAIGHAIYERLLGVRPAIALVNEQAYSGGLVGLYREAGYRALMMDWDNPSSHHQWAAETRYRPQRALGAGGETIGLLWTNTVAFQKLQRFAHGDIARDDYLAYIRAQRGSGPRALCVYASDAEIFDFRPGRYKTEEEIGADSEWDRLAEAFNALKCEPLCEMMLPSRILASSRVATQPLRLESPACPVPVKKQRKYNLSRWAVTGRDDIGINAACERIYRGLAVADAGAEHWKELCYLWASDFRTHITEKRWAALCARLKAAETRWSKPLPPAPAPKGAPVEARHIDIATKGVIARLDRRRGLALSSVQFANHGRPTIGMLPHGHFDDIALQADWYTGNAVFEAPGEHKVTDLERAEARIWQEAGDTFAHARIETPKGPIHKTMRFCADRPRIEFDMTFDWADWGKGSLRLGHVTLLPDAFDPARLSLTTHNGGKVCETFSLEGQTVEHGAPVSFLVSASHGIGMTEGAVEIGDDRRRIRIEIDREAAPLLGLLTHRRVGGSLFCQLAFSALELDDTAKPAPYRPGPRRFRFSVNGILPSAIC